MDDTLYAQERYGSLDDLNQVVLSNLDFDSLMEINLDETEEHEPQENALPTDEPAAHDLTNYLAPYEPEIPTGATDRQYDKLHFQIHDYFLAKTVDKLRVGGIMAFITTSGTMDKKSEGVRRYLAARCDLIGAVRLPNNTFTAQAGTTVTSLTPMVSAFCTTRSSILTSYRAAYRPSSLTPL